MKATKNIFQQVIMLLLWLSLCNGVLANSGNTEEEAAKSGCNPPTIIARQHVCLDNGATSGTGTITVGGASQGATYRLYPSTNATTPDQTATGDANGEATFTITGISTLNLYFITVEETGCTESAHTPTGLGIFNRPTDNSFSVSSNRSSVCTGGSFVISLSGTENNSDVHYRLLRQAPGETDFVPVSIEAKEGDGNAISWSELEDAGTYKVEAFHKDNSSCSLEMTGSATVTAATLPTTLNLNLVSTTNCHDEKLKLTGPTQTGVNYQLYNSSSQAVGASQAGNGGDLTWTITETDTYHVVAASDGCLDVPMNNFIDVYVSNPVFDVSSTGSLCSTDGVTISLSGSEYGVEYFLWKNGNVIPNSRIKGTGFPLVWNSILTNGSYEVKAVSPVCNVLAMNNTISISAATAIDAPALNLPNQSAILGETHVYTGIQPHGPSGDAILEAFSSDAVSYEWFVDDVLIGSTGQTGNIPGFHLTRPNEVMVKVRAVSATCKSAFTYLRLVSTDIAAPDAISESDECNFKSLYVSTTPPSGIKWYWQGTNKNGTDKSLDAAVYNYRVTQSATYYLRAYDEVNHHWGPSITEKAVTFTEGRITPEGCADVQPQVQPQVDGQYAANIPYNVVRSYDIKKSGMTEVEFTATNPNFDDVMISAQYIDGLGRPWQTVSRGMTSDLKDLVQPMKYDGFGRVVEQFLPYKSTTADGNFKNNPFNEQKTFYDGHFQNETIRFGITDFESSQRNRVVRQSAPGDSWAGQKNGVKSDYSTNNDEHGVRLWYSNGNPESLTHDVYQEGALSLTEITDEDGKRMREFVNKKGQVVLKQVQDTEAPGTSHTGWLNTYYVYDEYEQLTHVLPPKAVVALEAANWDWNAIDVSELIFAYTYDTRGRMISKKVPGAGLVNMIYDKLDRLVLTQDGNQNSLSTPQWTFTKYDELGRVVMTGLLNTTETQAQLQAKIDTWDKEWVVKKAIADANGLVTGKNIILYSHIPGTTVYHAVDEIQFLDGFDTDDEFETEIGGTLTASDHTIFMGYQDATFPLMADGNLEVLTVNYYDDYSFTPRTFEMPAVSDWLTEGTENAEALVVSSQTWGMATGSRVKILDTEEDWLSTVMFYDDKGRVIQTYSDNHTGGWDMTTSQYSFSSQVLRTNSQHKNPEGSSSSVNVLKKYAYDHANRLESIDVKIDASTYKRLVTYQYNALGEMELKKFGEVGAEIETLAYKYNIRGWLESINEDFVANGGTSHYFGMDLGYDQGFNQNLLNGNIAGISWRSKSFDKAKAYGFDYDASNRLLKADFSQNDNSVWSNTAADFSTTYGYDPNGNIMALNRKATIAGTTTTIDDLSYTYISNSNQLSDVTDTVGNKLQGDFRGDKEESNDYLYDVNGNLTQDKNKSIHENDIQYNHLNLVKNIEFENQTDKQLSYTYDAAGIKLRKTMTDGQETSTTDYFGDFIYENAAVVQMAHEEGRARWVNNAWVFDYFVKDHLGNTRVTLTEEVVETTYQATMESEVELSAYEEQLFLNIAALREVSAAANKTATAGNVDGNEAVRLNGIDANRQLGPAKMLQVMADDEVDIEVYAHYTGSPASHSPIADAAFATLIGNAFGGNSVGTAGEQQLQAAFENGANLQYVVPSSQETNNTSIKAYLNYVLFNSDFELVTSGFKRVDQVAADANGHRLLQFLDVSIEESGYLYVYVSNEGDIDFNVFFDELKIVHTKGAILQEDHYYPFGMNIQALSATAPMSQWNRHKFNGIEQETDFDLDSYSAFFRSYDPQLGRWWQVDPKASERESPYVGMGNNPIRYSDYLGDTINLAPLGIHNRDAVSAIIVDLQLITGLTLSMGKDGYLNYEKDENGNPVVSQVAIDGEAKTFSVGSKSARNDLIAAINGEMITVGYWHDRSKTPVGDSDIFLSPSQIMENIKNAPDGLNSKTLGFGMTLLHEILHTGPGGGFSDPKDKNDTYSTGPVVDRVNIYRQELDVSFDSQNGQYGQRLHYNAIPIPSSSDKAYVRFKLSRGRNKKGNPTFRTVKRPVKK